ncbi:MAG TPA: fumarate hydratase, partial [Smithellaceae bacterium]|nr:fumarate hydratase [Smithellaceae bacterium]
MNMEKKIKRTIRRIDTKHVTAAVKKLFIEANTDLSADVIASLQAALKKEESDIGRHVMAKIIENAGIACREKMPLCQDTGLAVVFAEVGQDVHIVGGDLR